MAIYVFNLLVGFAPCGVDNAQAYRAKMLNQFGDSVRYVFTEVPTVREIEYYSGMGISVDEMLSAHQCFTDNLSLEATESIDEKLHELQENLHYTDMIHTDIGVELLKEEEIIVSIVLDKVHRDCFRGIYYFKQAKLIRSEFYAKGLIHADYYVTATADGYSYAKLVRRTFFNSDGTVSYDQIFDNAREWYLLPDGRCLTKVEFMVEFIKKLALSEKDIIILDRFAQWDFVQPLIEFGSRARFIAVIHSGHYFEKNEGPAYRLYLNDEYFYLFKYTRFIDTIVVSTEEQKKELEDKLSGYEQWIPEIAVIPAGGIHCLRYPKTERKPYSLITASRLDRFKRVHEIIKSVIQAHKENSDISLDIYGSGDEDEKYAQELHMLVDENGAQQYIRFMGYADLTEIYKNYEVYLAASFMETWGLSVMEAVGSGLALIGLNVKYGNRLFIHPGKNGYLVDIDLKNVEDNDQRINDMAEKIVEIFQNRKRLDEFHQYSYDLGKYFLFHEIEEKWKRLLA